MESHRQQAHPAPAIEPAMDQHRRLGLDEHRRERGAKPSGSSCHGTTGRNHPVAKITQSAGTTRLIS